MYLPQSVAIAEAHPASDPDITKIDELIYKIGNFPIRADQMCDNVDIAPAIFRRLLELYVREGVLRRDLLQYCKQCDSLWETDESECDVCEAESSRFPPQLIEVYVPVDPVLRSEIDEDEDQDQLTDVRIQFVAGDRGGGQRNQLQTPKEYATIKAVIQTTEHRDRLTAPHPVFAASIHDFGTLYTAHAAILHFSGHGDDRSLTFLRDQELLADTVALPEEQIVAILDAFPAKIPLCIFNVCNSLNLATALTVNGIVDFAVGWNGKVSDSTAIAFSRAIYTHLGNGLSLGQAFAIAQCCVAPVAAGISVELRHREPLDPRQYWILNQKRKG